MSSTLRTGRSRFLVSARRLGIFSIVFCNALLTICFVCGWLGAYVSPFQVWWLQPAATFLPFTVVLLMGCALLTFLLLRKHWKSLLVFYLPSLLLVIIRFIPGALGQLNLPAQLGSVAEDEWMEVMTFNAGGDRVIWLFAWKDKGEVDAVSQEHRMLLAAGRWKRPHIACIQEAREEIEQEWPEALFDEHSGLAILPGEGFVRQVASPIHSQTTRYAERRSFLMRATYQWRGAPIAVFNVQLHSFSAKPWDGEWQRWRSVRTWRDEWVNLRRDYLIRAREAQQLRTLLESEDLPFIVCGDFNSTPHNWEYAHVFQGVQKFRDTGKEEGRATYPSVFPVFQIDHVLANSDWQILSIDRIGTKLSDHRPVVAKLRLREKKDLNRE